MTVVYRQCRPVAPVFDARCGPSHGDCYIPSLEPFSTGNTGFGWRITHSREAANGGVAETDEPRVTAGVSPVGPSTDPGFVAGRRP